MSAQMIGTEKVAKALNTSKGYLVVKGKVSMGCFSARFFGEEGSVDVDR